MWQEIFSYLLIALFVLHELEEIIFLKPWLARNGGRLRDRFPRIGKLACKTMEGSGRAGFIAIAAEELAILSLLFWYGAGSSDSSLWVGTVIMLAIHWTATAVQSVVLWQLVPGTVTALLGLAAAVSILAIISINGHDIAWGVGLFAAAMLNLAAMHFIVAKVNKAGAR